jgi:bifunctional polynucleotide phosphatase/kinase
MISNALSTLHIPVSVIVGYGKGPEVIKKPNPELFYKFIKKFNKSSFFVGDAAGRSDDFADSDLKFATNVGLKFYTPEEVFPNDIKFKEDAVNYTSKKQEIIIMVGYPASGKSTFVKTKLKDYSRLDGDKLKSTPKMIKAAIPMLHNGESVVFDSTNGKLKNRQLVYDLAKKLNIPVRCFVVDTSIQDAMQLNDLRAESGAKKIPKIAFYTYRKWYDPPAEDTCKIVKISVLN